MAITKSAKKALRQNLTRRIRNLAYKNKIKKLVKQVKTFISQKKYDEVKKLLPSIYKILDKAAKVNVLKKNTASRKKSRITHWINKAEKSNLGNK